MNVIFNKRCLIEENKIKQNITSEFSNGRHVSMYSWWGAMMIIHFFWWQQLMPSSPIRSLILFAFSSRNWPARRASVGTMRMQSQ